MRKYKLTEKTLDDGSVIVRSEWFEEHWYYFEDILKKIEHNKSLHEQEPYKSVTMVLNVIAKGYNYDEWLKSVGINADYITRIAKEKGTKIHSIIEDALYGMEIALDQGLGEILDKKEWKKVEQWYYWYEWLLAEHHLQTHRVEQIVFNEKLRVAGTVDWVGKIDDEVWLLDWKSGNNIHETANLQVSIYAWMYNKMVELGYIEGEKIQRVGVVHLGAKIRKHTKGTFHAPGIKVREVEDWNKEARTFMHVLHVFNWKNPTLTAPDREHMFSFKLSGGYIEGKEVSDYVREQQEQNSISDNKPGGGFSESPVKLFSEEGDPGKEVSSVENI